MKIINFNKMNINEKNRISPSQRSCIWQKEDYSFFVFNNDEIIGMYILMESEQHESFCGLCNQVDVSPDGFQYIYWIQTFKNGHLRDIFTLMRLKHGESLFIFESSDSNLEIWKYLGSTVYDDLYDDFREIHTLSLDVNF